MLSVYERYLILANYLREEGAEDVFNPETATADYGVDFTTLELGKDYEIVFRAEFTGLGIEPFPHAVFTDRGIKKLLQDNLKMQEEVLERCIECLEEKNKELDKKVKELEEY